METQPSVLLQVPQASDEKETIVNRHIRLWLFWDIHGFVTILLWHSKIRLSFVTNNYFDRIFLYYDANNRYQYSVFIVVLGQQIISAKFSFQFVHKVDKSMRTKLELVILVVWDLYLILPKSLCGSKTKIFSFVRNRINGWSADMWHTKENNKSYNIRMRPT